ncbi:MAG: DUF1501 domain-containing protein [Betaproteobacteria bacterium]|nr:DUF1501 domain-containing protein [Betaproteobacteria bacterium]
MQRRCFLRSATAGALAFGLPAFAAADASYRNLLILVELKGGNDGLNTVVPYADPLYAQLRPRIAIARDEVLQLDPRTGLHPALAPLLPLWQAGELAVVQGLGYASPNLSHFRSIEIWESASRADEYLPDGWLARAFAAAPAPLSYAADGVIIGSTEMGPLAGSARALALSDPEQFLRQARLASTAAPRRNAALNHILKVESGIVHAAASLNAVTRSAASPDSASLRTEFPAGPFGNAVRASAQLLASKAGVAAIRLTLNGFDTHQNQPVLHAALLKQLAEGLAALKSALLELGRWDTTLVMTYAEFGRRAAENGSRGTDHGTANAHFALGGRVRGGLYGEPPRLAGLESGNLPHALDFRRLYATALERWWGVDSVAALRGRFVPVELLRV